MRKFTITALLFTFIFIYSCRKNTLSSIDGELYDQIVFASNGKGVDYFILPESIAYSSIPQDPKNPLNPAKVELGKSLFHEVQLGGEPKLSEGIYTYSCASCHNAKAGFQACVAQGIGEGGSGFGMSGEGRTLSSSYNRDLIDVQPIRSPSAMNGAYQEVMLWNGQLGAKGVNANTQASWTAGTPKELNFLGYEGLETQAMAGQGNHRLKVDAAWLTSVPAYKELFDKAFPNVPASERISKLTVALAIAAYERTLLSNAAPFQKWLKGDYNAMTQDQKMGAKLFFGKAQCYTCHSGPALNSMEFYALGMSDLQNGVHNAVNIKPDAVENKGRGGFTGKGSDMYKFKVPQLYNLADSRFYGHGASFTSIYDVVEYKNNAASQNPNVPVSQLAPQFKPLNLSEGEIGKIVTFVEYGLRDPQLSRYVPARLPSGKCFPNADAKSRADMGCN